MSATAHRMLDLINDLLDVFRIESGELNVPGLRQQ